MKRIIPSMLLLAALVPTVQAEISANVGITSNYVFRGFTQTKDDPAVQGGVDYVHPSGFYAGAWASQVDIGNVDGLEIDTYAGLNAELQGGYLVDLGIIQYNYTDSDADEIRELYFGVGYGPLMVTYYWGDDTSPSNADYQYLDVKFKVPLPDEVSLDMHYGRMDPDSGSSYNDVSIGLSKEILGANLSVTATAEDRAGSKQEELFLTITKTFDL